MDYYRQSFKRKSFHPFKDTGTITDDEIKGIEEFFKTVKPLYTEIETKI